MSVKEVAAHFKVSDTSIYRSRFEFAELKRLKVGRRILFLRSSVEALDRKLHAWARAAADPAEELRQAAAKKTGKGKK